MKLKRPIPKPDLWPEVPPRLAEKIHAYFDRTVRIQIQVSTAPRRWEEVNVVEVEAEDLAELAELSDAERLEALRNVGELVKACAEAHAVAVGRSGKYRAAFVRKIGETDRRWATFPVDLQREVERRERLRRKRIQWSTNGNPWADLVIAAQALIEQMAEFNHRVMDQLLELRRVKRTQQDHVTMRLLFGELEAFYEEGLRMKAEAARAITEQRMEARIAAARSQMDSRQWEALAPVFDAVMVWVRDKLDAAQAAAGDAVEDEQAPDAERTEGAPPSSDDAPSAGKVRSGA